MRVLKELLRRYKSALEGVLAISSSENEASAPAVAQTPSIPAARTTQAARKLPELSESMVAVMRSLGFEAPAEAQQEPAGLLFCSVLAIRLCVCLDVGILCCWGAQGAGERTAAAAPEHELPGQDPAVPQKAETCS